MNKLYYWYFRKRYGYPCKKEIAGIVFKKPTPLSLNIRIAAVTWATEPNSTVESIAKELNVTRERVRQYLWKVYYVSKK